MENEQADEVQIIQDDEKEVKVPSTVLGVKLTEQEFGTHGDMLSS